MPSQVGEQPDLQPVHIEVDHWRCIEREHLADDQPAYDGNTQWAAELRAHAPSAGQRHSPQQCGHGRHHDRAKAQQRRLVDRVLGTLPLPFLFQREVDHHDGILFHNANEQDDADQRHDIQVHSEQEQGEQGPGARRGQRGEDRDGMNVTFIEDTQDDVDRQQSRQNQ